ncbi:MAG: hypothetical protein AB203_03850 [Parcubacteria bacterium C7867-008]|nr:MAG: hypothetical protein AB203_03850 [Parcubacteria bacterium C7867-008]
MCFALVLSLTFAPFSFSTPRASAQLPVTDAAVLIALTPLNVSAATSAEGNFFDAHIRPILDGLAWTVAKVAVQSLTRSVVNWINSGFQGSPAFVGDLKQNLQELGDTVADDFFDSLQDNTGVDVRSPFKDQVTQALRDNYYRTTGGFYGSNYDLDRYSDDPAAFVNGHFAKGGFDAMFAAMAQDENTPLGAYRAGQDSLARKVEDFRVNRLHELTWGKGFMSWRGNCLVKQPAGTPTSLQKKDSCLSYEIKTPGSVIESTLGITASSPLRQLELADSFNEIIGALAGQLVGQILGGTGLSGASQPRPGGGSSYLDEATDPDQYSQNSTSLANGFIKNVRDEQTRTKTYQRDWQTVQSAAEDAGSCVDDSVVLDAVERSKAGLEKASAALSALDKISAKISAAQNSTNSSAALTSVSAEFQELTSSGTFITAGEQVEAQTQASDSEGTLYKKLTATCGSKR